MQVFDLGGAFDAVDADVVLIGDGDLQAGAEVLHRAGKADGDVGQPGWHAEFVGGFAVFVQLEVGHVNRTRRTVEVGGGHLQMHFFQQAERGGLAIHVQRRA